MELPRKNSDPCTDDLFANVDSMLETFLKDPSAAKEKYKELREYMKNLGLLEITSEAYSANSDQLNEIRSLTDQLMAYP